MTLRHGSATDLFPSDGTSPSARVRERTGYEISKTARAAVRPDQRAQAARIIAAKAGSALSTVGAGPVILT